METDSGTCDAVVAALRSKEQCNPAQLRIRRTRMKGGLEAHCIERISVRYRDRMGRRKHASFVSKRLQGAGNREALVYEAVLASHVHGVAPDVYFVDRSRADQVCLLLEDVPSVCRWPWRDLVASGAVLQHLARFHAARMPIPPGLDWNYESELQQSAVATVETLDAMRGAHEWASFAARGFRPLDRLVSSLAQRRSALLGFIPHGSITIHGDVHPGNVILRRQNAPVLIDWGRARVGSALEDVSSWLQSLGHWEPEARKRHDTLLRDYLRACGSQECLSSDLRAAYWMAGASNALAGALRYHCWRASTARTVRARKAAAHAAASWLRVIIRADALSS